MHADAITLKCAEGAMAPIGDLGAGEIRTGRDEIDLVCMDSSLWTTSHFCDYTDSETRYCFCQVCLATFKSLRLNTMMGLHKRNKYKKDTLT